MIGKTVGKALYLSRVRVTVRVVVWFGRSVKVRVNFKVRVW